MKKQKMRAEKPCRTLVSEFQTEPYSASYGQKPFWRVPFKIVSGLGFDLKPILRPIWVPKGGSNRSKSCPGEPSEEIWEKGLKKYAAKVQI